MRCGRGGEQLGCGAEARVGPVGHRARLDLTCESRRAGKKTQAEPHLPVLGSQKVTGAQ